MAQNPKFNKDTLREFVIEHTEKTGSRPIKAEILSHFGGGNEKRLKDLYDQIVGELDAEAAELAKLPPVPDEAQKLAAQMATAIWNIASKQSSIKSEALEAQLQAKDLELDKLRGQLTERVRTLEALIEAETTKATQAITERDTAAKALAVAEKANAKLEGQLEGVLASVSRLEKQNDALREEIANIRSSAVKK